MKSNLVSLQFIVWHVHSLASIFQKIGERILLDMYHIIEFFQKNIYLTGYLGRWLYKHIFMADGNFKANHIWQKKAAGNIWLSEGCGMIPHTQEYMTFLASAIK